VLARRPQRHRPRVLLDHVLELGTGTELRNRTLLGAHPLAGGRVPGVAGLLDLLLEGTESGDGDLLAASDLAGDRVEHRLQRVRGSLPVALEARRQGVDQLTLVHKLPFRERLISSLLLDFSLER